MAVFLINNKTLFAAGAAGIGREDDRGVGQWRTGLIEHAADGFNKP
jgi:hypothetical protein